MKARLLDAAAGGLNEKDDNWNNTIEERTSTIRLLMKYAELDFTEPNNVGWRLLGIQSDCVTFEWPRRDIQVDAAVFRHLLDIALSHDLLDHLDDEMISLILNNQHATASGDLSLTQEILLATNSRFTTALAENIIYHAQEGNGGVVMQLCQRGVDPHHSQQLSYGWESLTSAAMRSSHAFRRWKVVLTSMKIDLEAFTKAELQREEV
jgi:hypothetical protein